MPFDIDTLNDRYSGDNSEILAAFARWCEMVRAHFTADDAIEAAFHAREIDRIEANARHAAHYDERMDLRDAMLRMSVADAAGLAVKMYLMLHFDHESCGDPAGFTPEAFVATGAEPNIYDDLARFIPTIPALDPREPIII